VKVQREVRHGIERQVLRLLCACLFLLLLFLAISLSFFNFLGYQVRFFAGFWGNAAVVLCVLIPATQVLIFDVENVVKSLGCTLLLLLNNCGRR
jgi:hypothetical protein